MKKSPNDHRAYRPLTLANGLQVLLVSNSEIDKAAAALVVNVGHFDDPKHRQGLAHFLEHMLFLGTEKYPDGSQYQQFINQYGGSCNAWTGTEHTSFFFDIHFSYFEQALDQFSQFFIAPLLSEEFVNQERQNVDAEFKLKLKDDIRRLYDVHKATINPSHPFAKFSVGNLATLSDTSDETIHQAVTDFYHQHYYANVMTLALEAPCSLDDLATLATEFFSDIRTSDKPKEKISTPLYLPEHLGLKLSVKPVKNDCQLILSFAMPALDKYYQTKPDVYLSYILGHEGPGSLLSLLKRQQWAMGLSAGGGVNGSNFKDFNISIRLTPEGMQHQNDIIALVMSTITLIKNQGITEQFFKEKQAIAKVSFLYQEKTKALDNVSHLALNMHHYPEQDYIFGDYAMENFAYNDIENLLGYMTPSNMRVIEIQPNVEGASTSKWYKVPYKLEPFTDALLASWQQNTLANHITLPKKNPYIVHAPVVEDIEIKTSVPLPIAQRNGLCVWHKQDQTFRTPKGYIYLGIDSPICTTDARSAALTRIFVELFTDQVTEQNYSAELAGIHHHLYSHQGGLTLQLSGLSAKQPELLTELLTQLLTASYDETRYLTFKQQLIRKWRNADKTKSISQLFAIMSTALQPNNYSSEGLANALEQCSFQEFCHFQERLMAKICVDVLIHGNWTQSQAKIVSEQIELMLVSRCSDEYKVRCPVVETQGKGELHFPLTLPDHDYAAVVFYPQAEKSDTNIALSMMLSHILSPYFFQQLRTEKQFGYLVGVGYIPVNLYPGIAFYIQSPHVESNNIVAGIDQFINSCDSLLSEMPQQQWQQIKHGLMGQLQEHDTSLRVRSQRFWMSLSNNDKLFTHKKLLIDAIEKLTLAEIIEYVRTKLQSNGNHIDRVVLCSDKKTINIAKESGSLVVKDIADFINNSSFKY